MKNFAIKKVAQTLLLIVGVTFLLYFLTTSFSDNYTMNTSFLYPIKAAKHSANFGISDNIIVRYSSWMKGLLTGSFGNSTQAGRVAVNKIIGEAFVESGLMIIVSLILSVIISVPMGIYISVRSKSWLARLTKRLTTLGVSFPSFIIAFLSIFVFYILLDWLPMSGTYISTKEVGWLKQLWLESKHYILPLISLVTGISCTLVLFLKTSLDQVLNTDYIRTARAKGLSHLKVVFKHGFKNAAIPWITTLGLAIPILFSELLIIEEIFDIPGIGKNLLRALEHKDYPVVLGFSIVLSLIIIIVNLIVELLYGWLNPKIRYE